MAAINLSASLKVEASTAANLTVVDKISPNDLIYAQHYKNLCGETLTAAPSIEAAKAKAGYLWGIGYGDRGYGQTDNPLSVSNASANGIIAQEWNRLRTVTANLAGWQSTNVNMLVTAASLNAGEDIAAESPLSITAALSAVDARRLSFDLSNMTLSTALTTTKSSDWGAPTGNIQAVFQAAFTDENAARYFFNTGGALRISLNHPSTATYRDVSWNRMLQNFNMSFDAHSTKMLAGNFGIPAKTVGFYELTGTYQTIVDGTNTGITLYGNDDFIVEARTIDIVGDNGGRGKTLQFRVTLSNDGVVWDLASSGTTSTFSLLRATSVLSISAPACTLIQAF